MAADNEIKVLLTAELGELKAGMEQAAESVAVSSEAMAASAAESAAVIQTAHASIGESAEAAAERLKAMVAASLEQAAADATLGESERSLAERMGLRVEATDVQLDATAAAINAQNAQMAGASDLAEAEERVTAATDAATAATDANTEAMVINGGVARELGVLTGEALRGNWTRLEGSTITLANRMDLLKYAFSGIGPYILGVVGAIAAVTAAAVAGAEEQAKFTAAVIMTGGAAGVTSGELQAMAERVGDATGNYAHAREALLALVSSGKVAGDQLEQVAQAAVQMSRITGESIDQTVEAFVKLQEKPLQAVVALNDRYHFLTIAIFDQIKALQEQGDTQGAAKVATEAYTKKLDESAKQIDENLGTLSRAWRSVGESASWAWDQMLNIGKADTLQDKIGSIQDELLDWQKQGWVKFNVKAGHVGWETTDAGKQNPEIQRTIDLQKQLQAELAKTQQAEQAKAAEEAKVTQYTHDHMKPDKSEKERRGPAEHTQSLQEQLAIQESLEKVSYDQRTQFELKFWQDKLATLKAGTAEYAQAYAQVATLEHQVEVSRQQSAAAAERVRQQEVAAQQRHDQQMAALAKKAADDNLHMWQERLRPISQAFQGVINGFIQGTLNWRQATQRVLQSVAAEYIQKGIEIVVNHAANEAAKTTATATGTAARGTIEAAAAVQSKVTDAATGKSQITTAAATGAAKAYQAIVGIPYVGPVLAPIAAGVAFAGIEAFSASIASARGGWDRVPFDGAMTELHKDEMVLPKPLADGVRQMAKDGQGGAPQVHLHTTDPRSFKDYLRRNPGAIASAVKLAGRRGHMLGVR
jgi:hypothetical protein